MKTTMQTSLAARQKDFSNFSQRPGAKYFSACQALSKVELAFWLLFWQDQPADVYIFGSALE